MALDAYAEKPPGTLYLLPLKFDACDIPDLGLEQLGGEFERYPLYDVDESLVGEAATLVVICFKLEFGR